MTETQKYTKPNTVYALQCSEFNSGKCKFIYFEYSEDCSDTSKAIGICNAMKEDDYFPYLEAEYVLDFIGDGNFAMDRELALEPFGYDGSHFSIIIHDRICVIKRDVVKLSNEEQ